MTTIAYRDGIMAADSLVSGGDIRRGYVQKIGTTALGSLVGVCGQAGLLDEVIDWLYNGCERSEFPKLPEHCALQGIIATLDGHVGVFSKDGILQWADSEFVAQGSGNEIAMGAMAMGATAVQAVEIASRFDIYTGGPIDILKLHDVSASPLPRTE